MLSFAREIIDQSVQCVTFSADFRSFRHFRCHSRSAAYSSEKENRVKGRRQSPVLNETLRTSSPRSTNLGSIIGARNWGVSRLASMRTNRSTRWTSATAVGAILFLDGLPNFQMLGRLRIGETVEEILRADLELEHEAVEQLKAAIVHCETVRDFVSRDLFRSILASEESHVDFLETQFEMIERMGLNNYVQLQSKPAQEEALPA